MLMNSLAIRPPVFMVRSGDKLAEIARERKPRMLLLPYGFPMAVGSILYIAMAAMWL
jgi:prepilin peptidase CpaA